MYMSLGDLLATTISHEEEEKRPTPRYKAVASGGGFGISEDGIVHSGICLEPIQNDEDGYDPLQDMIENLREESPILLPDDGLILGHIYEPRCINVSRDWESGIVDDWDIGMYDVTESDGDDSEEHF